MKCNEDGLGIIRQFEGLKLKAYKCPAGVWTIGYGHTGKDVGQGDAITEETAERLLRQDVQWAEKAVEKLVYVPLNQNQFSALISFIYNIGESAFRASRSLSILNRKHYLEFSDLLLVWNKAGGKELPGLTRRRKAERALFLKPTIAGGKDFA